MKTFIGKKSLLIKVSKILLFVGASFLVSCGGSTEASSDGSDNTEKEQKSQADNPVQESKTENDVEVPTFKKRKDDMVDYSSSALDEVKAKRSQIEQNKIAVKGMVEGEFGIQTLDEFGGYLTFTNDYTKTEQDKMVFGNKDFIYAHLKMPKKISSYLAKYDDDNLAYYRVKVIAKVNGRKVENNHKMEQNIYFKDGYDTDSFVIAIVPEKGFFQSIVEDYKEDGDFPDAQTRQRAYQNVLSRNTSRQIAELFKNLPIGEHKVEITFEMTSKMRGSNFTQIDNIKGIFLINVDAETKERYAQTFDLLSTLYRDYQAKENIARMQISEAQEEQMMENMSPRERERYNIAKKSPDGYMAAYKGDKEECTFVLGELRGKMATIDIVWNGAGEGKEAGSHSFTVFPKLRKKIKNIPVGAKVSINGRVLIPSVSEGKTVPVYWFY